MTDKNNRLRKHVIRHSTTVPKELSLQSLRQHWKPNCALKWL